MRSRTGYAELGICGLVWGSIGVIVREVTLKAPIIVFFRVFIATVALVAFFAIRGRLSELRLRDRRGLLIADGVLLAIHWALFFEAYKRLSVATTILVIYVAPVLVAALAPRFAEERIEPRTIGSLALSLGGMVLIAVPAWQVKEPAGLAFAIGSMLTWVVLMLASKRLTRSYEPPALLTWQLGIATVAIAPVLASAPSTAQVVRAMPALLALGLVHTAITGILYFRALMVVKVQHVGILAYLEPVTAVLYAWVFLSETPKPLTLAGGALVLAAGLNLVARRQIAPVSETVAGEVDQVAASPDARQDRKP
jgi:drug/metabolite transporter (DMT)-like permease